MTSEPTLTPNEILALVVLMVEARELTNNELKALAGFALTGAQNTKLVKAGLVETNRSHRPFSHQLTEKGWRVVRELHTVAPPKAGGSAIRSLFTVLGAWTGRSTGAASATPTSSPDPPPEPPRSTRSPSSGAPTRTWPASPASGWVSPTCVRPCRSSIARTWTPRCARWPGCPACGSSRPPTASRSTTGTGPPRCGWAVRTTT
ncbi:hypothetical protein ACFQX7_25505 [Luedemannella flava]